jgi:hypothetical protein
MKQDLLKFINHELASASDGVNIQQSRSINSFEEINEFGNLSPEFRFDDDSYGSQEERKIPYDNSLRRYESQLDQ